MSESDYWRKRQEKKYIQGENTTKEFYKGLEKSFIQAKRDIQSILNDFYVRYSIENDINNMAKAKRLLSKVEIGDLEAFIDKARENMGKYNLELNNMSIRARITRYEALQKQIDCILQQLYSVDYELQGKEVLTEVYKDAYYRTWFNLDQYAGFHAEYAQINPRTITELIAYPFDGANFSTRIWRQKDYLMQQLTESITTAIIQGSNPNVLARDFAKKFGAREFEAKRLLHTETSFVIEQASQAAYKEDGIEQYQWDATLDINTCKRCGELDGRTYDINKGITGKTLPPAHAFCRCTTIPYIPGMEGFIDSRIARGTDGKNYDVPGDMTYKEWHKKYIEDNPTEALAEKKIKNQDYDKKQYEKYRTLLGNNAPQTLDAFRDIKYNNDDDWNLFKEYSKAIEKGELTSLADFDLYKSTSVEIDNKLVGIKTSNAIDVTGKSYHFISRVIGSIEQKREGTSVDSILDALVNSDSTIFPIRNNANGNSQKIRSDTVEISINPDTGVLIQVNPWKKGK